MINKQSIEKIAENMVQELGIPTHIKGYAYLVEAICAVAKDDLDMDALYQQVATNNETTSVEVERAIRHSVEIAWDRNAAEFLQMAFGYGDDAEKRPTNEEFIVFFADKVQLEKMCEDAGLV